MRSSLRYLTVAVQTYYAHCDDVLLNVSVACTCRPAAATAAAADEDEAGVASSSGKGGWNEAGATCIACGIGISSQGFSSAAEQRQHFKTDWHRCAELLLPLLLPQLRQLHA
jgi:hypothetical protein